MDERNIEKKVLDPKAVIEEHFGRLLVQGKAYPTPLSDMLKPWYCYTKASGHSIVIALKSRFASHNSPFEFLELAPVKTVLRGYDVVNGYIVLDLSYSSQTGLKVPPYDQEW